MRTGVGIQLRSLCTDLLLRSVGAHLEHEDGRFMLALTRCRHGRKPKTLGLRCPLPPLGAPFVRPPGSLQSGGFSRLPPLSPRFYSSYKYSPRFRAPLYAYSPNKRADLSLRRDDLQFRDSKLAFYQVCVLYMA